MEINEIIEKQNIELLSSYLEEHSFKVGPQRAIMKKIAASSWNVDEFKDYSSILKWYWFNINLLRFKNFDDTMIFIDQNLDYFTSRYSGVGSLMFIKRKGLTFEKIYDFAKRYTKDRKREFVCRLGYLLFFMCPLSDEQIEKIEKLLHDDERYYVQMMEAWLLCEMVVRNPLKGYEVLKRSTLKYNILGKAIQKCQDSFRIKEDMKINIKNLREEKRLIK